MAEHETASSPLNANSTTGSPPLVPSFSKPSQEAIEELNRYAAHNAISGQASSLLAHLTTSVTLYFTVTGAAWAVVSSNTMAVETWALILILVLHILFSFGMWLALRGVGNNLIQRYNLARWLGIEFWPHIELLGRPECAWEGVPHIPDDQKALPSWQLKPETFEQWKKNKKEYFGMKLDHRWRYKANLWPSLRYQRHWSLLPLFGLGMSAYLIYEVHSEGVSRDRICHTAGAILSNPIGSAPLDREKFERAKYLFDKAACSVSGIDPK